MSPQPVNIIQRDDHYSIRVEHTTLHVDGAIANTLEFSATNLGLQPFSSHEYNWSRTCIKGVFSAGDVAEQPDLPRQAITAAYSGYLAGILALHEALKH